MKKSYLILPVSLLLICCVHMLTATNYSIGPGQTYTSIGAVDWSGLLPGDSVLIHYRTDPYREKWVICCKGSTERPIVVSGVADANGTLPVIDGRDAVTDTRFNYWNEERGVIKIGGSNKPTDTLPEHIIVQNLDICNGNEAFSFTGRNGVTAYAKNAAALYIEKGREITIRNCIFRLCGNGLFAAHLAEAVTISGCYYYDNGNVGSIYEHNNYTEAFGITFEYNRFGPMKTGAGGNNLKDRSSGCVIRYNWIEGGNRQLDLVESDYATFYQEPAYRKTFVYGNVLIENDNDGNSQIVHYGGDGDDETKYRKGTLYFYHNTILSFRSTTTTLLRLSTDDEQADVRNNILYGTAAGSYFALSNSLGRIVLCGNWIKSGWVKSHSNDAAVVIDSAGTITGSTPGFLDAPTANYGLSELSPCIDNALALPTLCQTQHPVLFQYAKHQGTHSRTPAGITADIGAYEFSTVKIVAQNIGKQSTQDKISLHMRQNRLFIHLGKQCAVQGTITLFTMQGQRILRARFEGISRNSVGYASIQENCSIGFLPVAYQMVLGDGNNVINGITYIQN
ncbi:MAG: hypothetical protein JW795_16740 [Chitinivibrionales bacterium]|nr:hypothetical protein [Chitinivibrionales bacterium]